MSRLVMSVLCLLCVPWLGALAHEVPRHVGVRAFVVPAPDRVRLLVQIPLEAVRDVDWPLRANGSLDVARAAPFLRDAAALWIRDGVALRDGGRDLPAPTLLAVRASLPSDRAFDTWSSALSAVRSQPLPDSVDVPFAQLRLEAELEVPAAVALGNLVIEPRWAHLGITTTTVLTAITANGAERVYTYEGDPGALHLDPRWWHAALRFVREGALHLFGGLDHLLFVLCLVLPVRRLAPLIGIVSAFTVAHSLTLGASALGFAPTALWFPPLVEVLIAASIVWMALGNIIGARVEQRWKVAFAFGLIHGFGFSTALRDQLQFAGSHLLTSLAAFNIGIELAQVAVLLALVPLLNWIFAREIQERIGVIVASALVAHEAWHWMGDRAVTLRAYSITMPVFDAAFAVSALRVAMAGCVVLAVVWAMSALIARLQRPRGALPDASRVAAMLLAGVIAVSAAPRIVKAQPRSTASGVYTAEQAQKGREVFQSSCLGCHTVASHTGPSFQLKWFGRPLADLYDYLSNLMPKSAPGTLTEDEYVWVTAYILRLNGMPPGKTELNAEPAWLKSVRVDSVRTGKSSHPSPAGR
jgi:mono/diheme cytochrome c family protein